MSLDLLQKIVEQAKMSEEIIKGQCDCTNLQREEGHPEFCGNYRCIKMISRTIKICGRIIDRSLREETSIGEEQFGFMPSRGTTDAIFVARQLGDGETPGDAERTAHGVY